LPLNQLGIAVLLMNERKDLEEANMIYFIEVKAITLEKQLFRTFPQSFQGKESCLTQPFQVILGVELLPKLQEENWKEDLVFHRKPESEQVRV
jgi:hypothetical protein